MERVVEEVLCGTLFTPDTPSLRSLFGRYPDFRRQLSLSANLALNLPQSGLVSLQRHVPGTFSSPTWSEAGVPTGYVGVGISAKSIAD